MVSERDLTDYPGSSRRVAVFEVESGRIVHVHQISLLSQTIAPLFQANLPEDQALLAQAISTAQAIAEFPPNSLDAIFITQPLESGVRYRIDPEQHVLVEAR